MGKAHVCCFIAIKELLARNLFIASNWPAYIGIASFDLLFGVFAATGLYY